MGNKGTLSTVERNDEWHLRLEGGLRASEIATNVSLDGAFGSGAVGDLLRAFTVRCRA